MIRVVITLAIIFVSVSGGVYFGYGQLEKKLLVSDARPGKNGTEKTTAKNQETTILVQDATVTSKNYPASSSTQGFQVIVSRNIFEAILEPVVEVVKEVVVEEVVPTALNLTLLGTVTGNNRTARAIIIDNNKKKQDIFQIGDAVQGAFIEAIERGKVTLEVNGKMEALVIKHREGGGPGPPKLPTPSRPRIAPRVNPEKINARKPPVRPNRRISFRSSAQVDRETMIEPDGDLPEYPELPDVEDGLPPLE